jgi:hypothetical protein
MERIVRGCDTGDTVSAETICAAINARYKPAVLAGTSSG